MNSVPTATLRPCITEKTTILAERNQYTYYVDDDASKPEIASAFTALTGVEPIKVNVITQSSKSLRTKIGTIVRSRPRKAIVTVAKGSQVAFL